MSEEKKTLQGTAVQRKYTTRYKILYKDLEQRLTGKKRKFLMHDLGDGYK